MTVLVGGRVVTPAGVLDGGWVELAGTAIVAVGSGPPPGGARVDLAGAWLLPGFIDIHVHGGGGHDFGGSPDDLAAGIAFHRSRGTTRTLVSLVTAPVEALCEQLRRVAERAERDPSVVGAHLEGPFLSRVRCGAQHPEYLLEPDRQTLDTLLKAGRGQVRMVTVAPELPGALELIDHLVEAGVTAAVGHTDATYAQAMAAFARGARLLTHAFNGMRPLHHREPGPVAAALDAGVACEAINDRVHVHPAVLRLIPPERLILVTDAIDAAGQGDGRYRLGGQDVSVVGGQARLVDGGALAGSTLTLDDAVRRAVLDVGLNVPAASAAASAHPAGMLGIADRCGVIVEGRDADLVLLDDGLRVRRVMVRGRWLI
jgi:N-acetylglucosamine-6-phosphate deacetylase